MRYAVLDALSWLIGLLTLPVSIPYRTLKLLHQLFTDS
jgi:hypothetical protein